MADLTGNGKLKAAMQRDDELRALRRRVFSAIVRYRYTYNFTWLGRPIIQGPEDILAVQEAVFAAKPDLIIETGVAHGGSVIYSASLLHLLGEGEVVGVDVDIRPHNRAAIEAHPLAHRIRLIQGSSIAPEVVEEVRKYAATRRSILVLLDSNHTHDHVLRELQLYSPFVTKGSYLIVFDTAIEDLDDDMFPERPWSKGNNPKTAVWSFLDQTDRFVVDEELESKLLFSVAPGGYLKCVKD